MAVRSKFIIMVKNDRFSLTKQRDYIVIVYNVNSLLCR